MHTQPKPGIAYPKTSSLLLLLQFFSFTRSRGGVGEEMEFASRVLRQENSGVTLHLARPGLVWACSHSPECSAAQLGTQPPSLGVGHCGLNPALQGARAGLFAHCTSLCIPSLFPMQIKLMRIRNIMEPIHRSSRWKMGLTTNFPLQLFCNYRGIL